MLRYFAVFFYQMQNKTQKQTQKFAFNLSSNKKQEKHNGAAALKEGGILIAVLRCEDMTEPPAFFESFRYRDLKQMEMDVRADFTVPFYVAFYMCCLARHFTIILVTEPENFANAEKT